MNECDPPQGKMSVSFYPKCLTCKKAAGCSHSRRIDVKIEPTKNGEPAASPDELLVLLMRILCIPIATSNASIKDAFKNTCHMSGYIADELQNLVDELYDVKLHLPPPKSGIDA